MIVRIGLLSTCMYVFCVCSTIRLHAEQTAAVSIELVDSFGRSAGGTTVLEFVNHEGKDFADRFHGTNAAGIPFGIYRFRLSSEKLGFRSDRLEVDRDQVSVVVTGFRWHIDYARGKEPRLQGELLSVPPLLRGAIWVRLVPIYEEWSKTVPVHEGHTFTFVNIPAGAYVVIVASGPNVLKTAPVVVEHPRSFMSIDLAESGRVQVKAPRP